METLGQPATLPVKKVRKRCEVYPRMGTPALLSLVFLCVLCASVVSPASAQTTITGTVKDASGTALASGTIIFTLSQEGTVSDPALLVVQPVVTCTITSGVIGTCSLRGNDEISPAGTFYRLRIISTGGRTFLPERTYTITGATWDIGTATPLASDTIAAQAYQIVQDEGANLTQRQKLNFTGVGVACTDDSANARTTCDLAAASGGYNEIQEEGVPLTARAKINFIGAQVTAADDVANGRTNITITSSGGGATHQIDGVDLTTQDPINFLDTSEFDWTNPAAGDLSLALKAASVADSKLTSNYSGVGSCTNQFVRGVNDDAAPTCESIADADLPSTNALDSELHAQSHVLAGSDHTASGLTTGNVVRATGPTAFAWQQLGFSDLSGSATKAQLPAAIAYEDEANIFTAAGGVTMDNNLGLRIRELTSNGTSYLELLGPAALSANVTYRWNITGDCTGNVNSGALTINASKEIICSDDDGGAGGSGDAIEVEDGDDAGTFTSIDTTARFDDSGDINFTFTDGGTGGPDTITATVRADSVALSTDTTGNYVGTVSAVTGIAVTGADAENATKTVAFDFSDAGADPALGAEECRFSNEGASAGGWVCEGATADTIETRFRVTDPTSADRVIIFPDAGGEITLLGQTIEDGELATDFISEVELDTEAELEAQLTDVTDVLTDAAGSCTNQVVTAVNDGAAPTCSNVSSAMISDGVVASADLATANKTFVQPVVLFDSTGLLDADDIPSVFRAWAAMTLKEVWCETDAGTPSVNFQRDDGTPVNVLSSNLTPTVGGATGTIDTGEDNFAADERLDFVMVSGSTAKRISCMVKFEVD